MQRRKYQEMTVFGISLGMMSCFVSIGTVIFQTAVNRLGTKIVTAHIAARRIEELTNVPMLCTGMAMTTDSSQNLVAGEYDRIKKGIQQAFVIVLVQGVIFTTFCWIFGHPLIRWITSSNDTYILNTAYRYLTRNTSFYFVLGPLFVLRCSLQGLEHKVIPVASSAGFGIHWSYLYRADYLDFYDIDADWRICKGSEADQRSRAHKKCKKCES